ncbi:hypothetical protein [Bradyrhizobium japonicum]|uniref:hypothetical protein n=1 Tax=Bradyrhizobium japonicum TaxID=375 RepID=UPI001BA6EA21|nr:hypothetical protein [Bradyrhizobium japonicum]MBR0959854.1 hypothetical protein [Bradyrhizobium japonicum]
MSLSTVIRSLIPASGLQAAPHLIERLVVIHHLPAALAIGPRLGPAPRPLLAKLMTQRRELQAPFASPISVV